MSTDLTGLAFRLRDSISDGWSGDAAAADAGIAEEAAKAMIESRDEIGRLTAENERLKAALEPKELARWIKSNVPLYFNYGGKPASYTWNSLAMAEDLSAHVTRADQQNALHSGDK